MLDGVPLFVFGRVVEPIVGAEVDHLLAARQELGDGRRAGTVRQAAEHAIGPFGHLSGREIFESRGRADRRATDALRRRSALRFAAW